MHINKYYVVVKGRQPGIYFDWISCKKQVDGYIQAKYHSFKTLTECNLYINKYDKQDNTERLTKVSQGTLPLEIDSNTTESVKYNITLFSDGGNRNTGNKKGSQVNRSDKSAWAYQIVLNNGHTISSSHAYHGKTNNSMEISGLINGLNKLISLGYGKNNIRVISDSKYVLDAINKKWIYEWYNYHWTRKGKELKNSDLWEELYNTLSYFDNIKFDWTKGHSTSNTFESKGNISVDYLLNQAMDELK